MEGDDGEAFGEVWATDRRALLGGGMAVPFAAVLMGPAQGRAPEGWPALASYLDPSGPAAPSARLSPGNALAELFAGNRRFVAGEARYGHHVAGAVATAGDQRPFAAVLGCVDSRVPVEAVFDQGFGAILVTRSAGHVLDRAVLGSIELAVDDFAVPLVMVLGHTRCGAVQVTIDAVAAGVRPPGERSYLVDQIEPAVVAANREPTEAAREHVRRTVASLQLLEPVRRQAEVGALTVAGALYHLDSGRVEPVS
jgi:carbonic anhydrase